MSDDGHFRFASFGGIRDGGLLLFDQPLKEITEDLGEVIGATAGVFAVGKVSEDVAKRWPVEQNAKAETVRAVEKFAAETFVKRGSAGEADIEAMNEEADVALVLVFRVFESRKLVGGGSQELKFVGVTFCQRVISLSGPASLTQ
jgi:hypothetical protein